jgi:hypothetical protein
VRLFRIGIHRNLSLPRRVTVGLLRAVEAIVLKAAGRRWKVDKFNRLTESDVRETAKALRAAGAKTIVGIPFYKEVTNIGCLSASVQLDLESRGQNAAIVIVGERKTKEILFGISLPPSTRLVTVARLAKPFGFGQKPGLSRRSWSHWEILQIASHCGANVVFIDADVRNSEGWIHRYLDAIEDGAQIVVADYVRQFDRDDAMVHIWDSLLFGALFKKWVAFRHGGDYAISKDFVRVIAGDHSIMRERTYTLDSAIIARAASSGASIVSVWLGNKKHEPISPENLFQRLPDLVRSVFDDVATHLPRLLRFQREEAVLGPRDPALETLLMRDLVGPGFRRELHADMVRRFRQSAGQIHHTLGSTQFSAVRAGLSEGDPNGAALAPHTWAKATLRFLMRYIRNPGKSRRATLVNGYVPVLELGVLGFLNRTHELTWEEAIRCLERQYLPEFQQIWNGLSRRLTVYRLAALRRWPQATISRVLPGSR